MKTSLTDNTLTIHLEGRIDSSNAAQVGQEAMAAVTANPGAELVLDAENLEYLSSAGLRVLMNLRKQAKKALPVWNVSPEVYAIFDITGFTDLLEVHKALRQVSVEGCTLLGEGAIGKVYRYTLDEMIKVFRPGITLELIEQERDVSRKALLLGVPCAIPFDTVRCGESYGTIYEMIKAETVMERIQQNPNTLDHYAEATGRLLRQLHDIEVPEGQMPRASRLLHSTVDAVAADFTPEEVALMHRLYDAIPEQNRFIHNDYHAKNVMETGGELILIDLGDSGAGNPLIDLIHCYVFYLLLGGGTAQHSPDELSFVGLTYGQMERFWAVFLPAYCGSEEEAKRLNQILEPYARLMYLTMTMTLPSLPAQYRAVIADQIRALIFPRAQEMMAGVADTAAL